METLTKKIEILEDGKMKATTTKNEVVYLQPMIYVDTLEEIERILLEASPHNEEEIRVDTSISEIDGVSFAGTFAQLETALRDAAKKANNIFLGTGSAGSGTSSVDIVSDSVGLAKETTLQAVDTVLDNIKLDTAKLDANLSTLATETTTQSIDSSLKLGTTSTHSVVAASATVVTLLAANTSRKSAKITNNGNQKLYIKEGSGAATSSFAYVLESEETLIVDDYNGVLTGIWNVANGDAQITETT